MPRLGLAIYRILVYYIIYLESKGGIDMAFYEKMPEVNLRDIPDWFRRTKTEVDHHVMDQLTRRTEQEWNALNTLFGPEATGTLGGFLDAAGLDGSSVPGRMPESDFAKVREAFFEAVEGMRRFDVAKEGLVPDYMSAGSYGSGLLEHGIFGKLEGYAEWAANRQGGVKPRVHTGVARAERELPEVDGSAIATEFEKG